MGQTTVESSLARHDGAILAIPVYGTIFLAYNLIQQQTWCMESRDYWKL